MRTPPQSKHTCVLPAEEVTVNGVRFHPMTLDDLVWHVEGFLSCEQNHVIHFLASDPTVRAADDPSYLRVLNRGDVNVADGSPITLALRLAGSPAPRIAGTDALELLFDWGVERNVAHYLYGGSEELLSRLTAKLEAHSPGARIAGTHSPPFRPLLDDDLDQGARRIREAGTDLLWIGLGTPKQHLVASRLKELGAARVILCVGAAFDFASGTKRRAPIWMQRAGLEWVHRLATEPRRLWRRYLIGNPRFIAGVIRERLGDGRSTEARDGGKGL